MVLETEVSQGQHKVISRSDNGCGHRKV